MFSKPFENPSKRQTSLFSATMTAKVKKLQRAALKNPVKVSINSKYKTVDKNIQKYLFMPENDKVRIFEQNIKMTILHILHF